MTSDPEKDAKRKALDEFDIARAKAINEYAVLEQHLCIVYETLLKAPTQQAYAAYAAFASNQTRMNTIGRLLLLSHGDKYDKFFQSLSAHMMGISGTRNKIVHWLALHSSTGGKPFKPNKDIFLASHPDLFLGGKLYRHELIEFTHRTRFISRLTFYFGMYLRSPALVVGDPKRRPWPDIFLEEISYPRHWTINYKLIVNHAPPRPDHLRRDFNFRIGSLHVRCVRYHDTTCLVKYIIVKIILDSVTLERYLLDMLPQLGGWPKRPQGATKRAQNQQKIETRN